MSLAPSSSLLSWAVVGGLLCTKTHQSNWKPPEKQVQTSNARLIPEQQECYAVINKHTEFHDEMYDEAGKLPVLSNLLVTALSLFSGGKHMRVIPQARIGHRTDYSITMVELEGVRCFHIINIITFTVIPYF